MGRHLAVMTRAMAEAVLTGKKTVESRFSQSRISPFGQVRKGDLIYIKIPGREVVGQFRASKVIYFDGLQNDDFEKIKSEYSNAINSGDRLIDAKYWQNKLKSRYLTLIFIERSERFITAPIRVRKKDQRGWMVLK